MRDWKHNAYLVNSHALRAVRVGGNWNNGQNDGPSNVNANNAPSNGNANYGGDLYYPSYRPDAAIKSWSGIHITYDICFLDGCNLFLGWQDAN